MKKVSEKVNEAAKVQEIDTLIKTLESKYNFSLVDIRR